MLRSCIAFNPLNMAENDCILDNVTLINIQENNRDAMHFRLVSVD